MPIGTQTIQMASNVVMGMAVSSTTTAATATATIDHVDVMTNVPQRSTGMVAWYRADAGVVESSGAVSGWQDQSGNGNTLAQATGTLQPSFVAASLNGQPVLHFTHASNSYLSVANNATLNPTQVTIFAVTRNTGTTAGRIVDKLSGTSGYTLRYSTSTVPQIIINAVSANGSLSPTNTWGVVEAEYDPAFHQSLYVNGTATSATGTAAIITTTQGMSVGGLATTGTTADADIAEILIFNSALSVSDRQNVEAYLFQKYNVSPSPMAVAPNFSVPTGFYGAVQTLTLTAPAGETIYYSTTGGTPSTLYTGPITVGSTETVSAMATLPGFTNSSVVSRTYTIDTMANFDRTSLAAWYRADMGITQSGGAVSQWTDLSGYNNTMTQSTGTKQPSYTSSSINGQPALHFTASSATAMTTPSNATLAAAQITIIAVARHTATTASQAVVQKASSYAFYLNNGTAQLNINGTVTASATLAQNTYGVIEGVYNQTAVSAYANGSSGTSAFATAIVSNANAVNIGGQASFYLDGDVAEVLIFSSGISDLQRHQVDAYLYHRYGITAAEPPAPAPSVSEAAGFYTQAQTVTIAPSQPGDTVYYTIDGSDPATSPTRIAITSATPITISSTTTLRTIENGTYYTYGNETNAVFVIDTTTNFTRDGLVAWWRADVVPDGTTNGSSLASWPDLSGTGNTLTQATVSKQPTWNTGVVNGQAALHFTGASNGYLGIVDNATLDPASGTITLIAVARQSVGGTSPGQIIDKLTSTAGYMLRTGTTTGASFFINGSTKFASGTLGPVGTWEVLEGLYDQSNLNLYINGTKTSTAYTVAVASSTSGLSVGGYVTAGNTPDADIAEIMIFNRNLTDVERHDVDAYLYNRYGIASSTTIATPVANVLSGLYGPGQTVSLSTTSDGATIYYTTDGTPATTSSTPYTGPISLSSSETINAIAAQSGFITSKMMSNTYTIDSAVNFNRTGLKAWYRADLGVTQASGLVSQWNDQSGAGNHLTQTTLGLEPSVQSNVVGGKPAMHFTHANNSYLGVNDNTTLDPTQITIFSVVRNTGTTLGTVVSKLAAAGGYAMRFSAATTPIVYMNGSGHSVSGSLASNTWAIMDSTYNQVNVSLYVNGVLTQLPLTPAIPTSTSPLDIGGLPIVNNTPDSDVAEVLIFNNAMSDQDRHAVEAYLYGRYNAGTSPVASAPILNGPSAGQIYTSSQTISLTPGQPGETIYYTTDGSTPVPGVNGFVYTGPITVNSTETINAIAVQTNYSTSSMVSLTVAVDTASVFTRSGLVAWYRSDIVPSGTTSGSNLAAWQDQSGNNNNLSQVTSAKQPTWSTGVNNGLPALHFTGANNSYLTVADNATLDPTGGTVTVVAVARESSGATHAGQLVDKLGTSSGYSLTAPTTTSVNMDVNGTTKFATTSLNPVGSWNIVEGVYDQKNIEVLASSASGLTAYATAVANSASALTVGGSATAGTTPDADISEVLVFNRSLSTGELHDVETYLYNRYGMYGGPFLARPVPSVPGGIYSSAQNVTLTAENGTDIFYTTGAGYPTTPYTGPITISSNTTIHAIASQGGRFVSSTIMQAVYTIDPSTIFNRTGLTAWYRADVGTGASANGSSVAGWQDQSGTGNHLFQTTTGMQPTWQSSVLNGQPALHFTNANNSYLGIPDNSTLDPSKITMFSVVRNSGTSAGYYVSKLATSAGYAMRFSPSTTLLTYMGGTAGTNATGVILASNTWGLAEARYDQTNISIYVNGTLNQKALTTAIPVSSTEFDIGGLSTAGNTPDCDLAEVLIFNYALADQDRQAVEQYLQQRYNLPQPTLAAPLFSVVGGALSQPSEIAINVPDGASVYYTLDGSTPVPGTNGILYTGPIFVYYTETIKAVVYENGSTTSAVTSQTYTLDPVQWPAPTTGNPTPPTITLQLPMNATLLP